MKYPPMCFLYLLNAEYPLYMSFVKTRGVCHETLSLINVLCESERGNKRKIRKRMEEESQKITAVEIKGKTKTQKTENLHN
jgi:hypothetical protein